MKICLICKEDVNSWILGKFALRMKENLTNMGYDVSIGKTPDQYADINHYILYSDFDARYKSKFDSIMITHIDNIVKLQYLKENDTFFDIGICMSKETMQWLIGQGIKREKLCYINPAHDNRVTIKKDIIGITCRVQSDGRKNEKYINKLAKVLDPSLFSFKIMGDSWDSQVYCLRKYGFEVEYFDHFIQDKYYPLISSLDYYLYMGMDEGQMGFLDAAAAGVETIVTAQGYHLDADGGISYKFITYDELETIFKNIQEKRQSLIQSVRYWTWKDYCIKHEQVWDYLIKKKLPEKRSIYTDGINSLIYDKSFNDCSNFSKNKVYLLKSTLNQYRYKIIDKILKNHIQKDSE